MFDAVKLTQDVRAVFAGMQEYLGYLYSRWQDEKEYEDFQEYEDCFRNKLFIVNPNAVFVKATKKPFGFQYKLEGLTFEIFATSKSLNSRMKK